MTLTWQEQHYLDSWADLVRAYPNFIMILVAFFVICIISSLRGY